jgi:hypothetical protein
MNFITKLFNQLRNKSIISNQKIIDSENSLYQNKYQSSLILDALNIIDNYELEDKNMLIYKCLNTFIVNRLFIVSENLILKLENSNRNKYDQNGGYFNLAVNFAYENDREKSDFFMNKIQDLTFKSYKKTEIDKIFSSDKKLTFKNKFPERKLNFNLSEGDTDFLTKCSSKEDLNIFLERYKFEEEQKTKSKDWRAYNVGQKFENFFLFYLNKGELDYAELIIESMPSKIHKWNSLKNLALEYSDLEKSLEIIKLIKDSNVKSGAKGLLGINKYETNGFDISVKLISETDSRDRDLYYTRFIEKLIENNKIDEVLKVITFISHDLFKYSALTFIMVYYLQNKKREVARELISHLSLPEFKVKFLGALMYFENKINNVDSKLDFGWFHFAPNRYENYETEFWELFERKKTNT